MEINEERQFGGLTSESVRRSDRGTMSFRETRLTAKAKRTVTKRGAASEPRAALIKHLHHTVSETQGSHQGVGVGGLCTGPEVAARLWILHKFTKIPKCRLRGPDSLLRRLYARRSMHEEMELSGFSSERVKRGGTSRSPRNIRMFRPS